jgi:hypothetical protein
MHPGWIYWHCGKPDRGFGILRTRGAADFRIPTKTLRNQRLMQLCAAHSSSFINALVLVDAGGARE